MSKKTHKNWKASRDITWHTPGEGGRDHTATMITPHGIVAIERFYFGDKGMTTFDFVWDGRLHRCYWDEFLTDTQCNREAWKMVQEVIAR